MFNGTSILRTRAAQLVERAPGESVSTSDAQLLEGFTQRQDQAAFAALVRRHGPMVFGVCRRVLKDVHAAEDAFQATFLVLVRKACSLARPELLGNWLYGVAYRTAVRARMHMARRSTLEKQAAPMIAAAPNHDLAWQELRAVLDEEMSHLPEKYRAPLVLCYLQGRTNAEAARCLGCPAGSMAGRLARGRELLRRRLTRRGLALSAALLALLLVQARASAEVPAALAASTVRAAMLCAFAQAVLPIGFSARMLALAHKALNAPWANPLRRAAIGIALALGTVGGVLAYDSFVNPAGPTGTNTSAASSPNPEKPACQGRCQHKN